MHSERMPKTSSANLFNSGAMLLKARQAVGNRCIWGVHPCVVKGDSLVWVKLHVWRMVTSDVSCGGEQVFSE